MRTDSEITGIYRIYQNQELIAEAKNALTETGKDILVRYLLKGRKVQLVNSLCAGISNAANTVASATNLITNNSLGFQVAIVPCEGASFGFTDDSAETVVYSGTLYGDLDFTLYELGITSRSTVLGAADPELLFNFDSIDTFTKYGTGSAAGLVTITDARIGTQMLSIPVTPTPASDYIEANVQISDQVNNLNFVDTYSSKDIFILSALQYSPSVSSVSFVFSVDASNYFTLHFPLTTASGYKITSATKGSAVQTGTPLWSEVTNMKIYHNSASTVFLDGLRIENAPGILDRDNGLISRAVLSSPVAKLPGTPLDIEYSLVIGFNKGV